MILARPGMKVAMVPQFGKANPYVTLLRDSLAGAAIDVTGLSTRAAIASPPAILHYHWPQNVVSRRSVARGLKNAVATLLRIDWLRLRGTRLVWTVHNLHAHSSGSRRLEHLFMTMFVRRLDGIIFLDPSLREEAIRMFPQLASKPWTSIPHGTYGAAGAKGRKREYRRQFGLSDKGPVVGFIGDIRPYKGITSALAAFECGQADVPALFIAGAFSDEQEAEHIRERIDALRSAGHRITLIERRLDDREIAEAIRACDALLLPYRAGSNSGLAVLGLEAQVPLICSDLPMFRSTQDEVGRYWVRIVEEWTAKSLKEAMAVSRASHDLQVWQNFIERRQWTNIAAMTRDFYRRLNAGPQTRVRLFSSRQ
jgi:beta-1,4-mannosyltransferase